MIYNGIPLERPGKSHLSCKIWSISKSNHVYFTLTTGHLFWKDTILGGLYRGVPLLLELKIKCYVIFQVSVYVRLVFLKIGDVDTVNEQFAASLYLEYRWHEPLLDKLNDEVNT